MIPVGEMYEDVSDALLTTANGSAVFELYNRFSRLAELDLIDWLTGKLQGKTLPEPYNSIKDKDYLAPFIERFPTSAVNGMISRPKDYYGYENMYLLGNPANNTSCDDEEDNTEACNIQIELLDSDVFNTRCVTYVKALKPSLSKPIAQAVGKEFEFKPKDCGSLRLDYYRYPKFAKIVSGIDPVYNDQVIDVSASTDYEWDDKARPYLLFFIVDRFANRTSNQSMKQYNASTIDNPEK